MQDGAESMRDELSKMMSFLFVCFLFCCCCLVEGELGGLRQEMDFTAFWLVVLHTVSTLFSSPFLPYNCFPTPLSSPYETHVEDEEGLYDCVYGEDEGGEVYEDLMKAEEAQQSKCPENDIRSCCLAEIKQTEEKYTETLESIEKYFMAPLKRFLTAAEFDSVFINIPELVKVHRNLMQEIHDSIVNKNDQNLYQVFINYKERLVIYGQYCSGVESAISSLDYISKTKEDVKLKLEECSKRANNGKFTLRDLLVVPMQRVLKYHLLLQELVKHTTDPMEKANLKLALDAMKDLAQYVNEVKRDNETLREIKQFQLSIENLNQPVLLFGRPQGDGEIRITTLDKHTKQERHIFLFDLAVIVCKRKGDNYEMKEIIDLQQYKIANNPTTDKENKKWSHGFYLIHIQGQNGLEFYCKTKDLKKKWLEQFEMALGTWEVPYHPKIGNRAKLVNPIRRRRSRSIFWKGMPTPALNGGFLTTGPRGNTTSLSFELNSVQSLSRFDSLRPHELQHARPPCPSPTPGSPKPGGLPWLNSLSHLRSLTYSSLITQPLTRDTWVTLISSKKMTWLMGHLKTKIALLLEQSTSCSICTPGLPVHHQLPESTQTHPISSSVVPFSSYPQSLPASGCYPFLLNRNISTQLQSLIVLDVVKILT
ncbi:hypothetical protein FD755_000905, partial [Muntiacus reevesi]